MIGMWIEVMIFVRRDFCYNKQKPANSGHWSRNGDGVGWWYSMLEQWRSEFITMGTILPEGFSRRGPDGGTWCEDL